MRKSESEIINEVEMEKAAYREKLEAELLKKQEVAAFEDHASATLNRASQIFSGRGKEYGDTWGEAKFLNMIACAKAFGIELPEHVLRILATAAFCDMKYWRLLGGYKDDSLIDGINYTAFLAEDMVRTLAKHPPAPKTLATVAESRDETSSWMQTYTGKKFLPHDPRPEDIDIRDIAHGLARICRFAGHVKEGIYTVAQHSVLVEELVRSWSPDNYVLRLKALLHDAPEAYVGDVIRPRKARFPQLKAEELRIWQAICSRLDLSCHIDECIHEADCIILVTEKRDVMGPSPAPWSKSLNKFKPVALTIKPWPVEFAEDRFLQVFNEISSKLIMLRATKG